MAGHGANYQSLTPIDSPKLLCILPQEPPELDHTERKLGHLIQASSPLSNHLASEESSEVETASSHTKERDSVSEMLDEAPEPPLRLLQLRQHPQPMEESSSRKNSGGWEQANWEQAKSSTAASKVQTAESGHQTNMHPRLLRKKHSEAGCKVPLLRIGRSGSQRSACALR